LDGSVDFGEGVGDAAFCGGVAHGFGRDFGGEEEGGAGQVGGQEAGGGGFFVAVDGGGVDLGRKFGWVMRSKGWDGAYVTVADFEGVLDYFGGDIGGTVVFGSTWVDEVEGRYGPKLTFDIPTDKKEGRSAFIYSINVSGMFLYFHYMKWIIIFRYQGMCLDDIRCDCKTDLGIASNFTHCTTRISTTKAHNITVAVLVKKIQAQNVYMIIQAPAPSAAGGKVYIMHTPISQPPTRRNSEIEHLHRSRERVFRSQSSCSTWS